MFKSMTIASRGANGIDGINGMDGINGTNGINGVDGINGTNGVDGADGEDGAGFPIGEGTALPASTGTITATMDGTIKRITPSGACTFNASGGTSGQICTFIITTTGTTSRTLTWNTNFKAAGTLATGVTSGKKFSVTFVYDGTIWQEIARTIAM